MTSELPAPEQFRIRLRPLAEEHLEATFEWIQDRQLRHDFRLNRTIDWEAHWAWFESLAQDRTQAVFAVEEDSLGHLGNAGVKNLEKGRGELWIYLKPGPVRGRGLGFLAARELVRILFQDLGLKVIFLHVAETNLAALRLYEKLGFVRSRTGLSPEWEGKKGKVVQMELARSWVGRPPRDKPKTILLAGYDAGGANALAVLAKELGGGPERVLVLAAGPARKVFQGQGIEPWQSAEHDLSESAAARVLDQARPGCLVLGTSLHAWTEKFLCAQAGAKSIPRISLVDFWSNYALRFSNPDSADLAYLPDRVAVPDDLCRAGCVEAGIAEDRLRTVGNPYWDHLCAMGRVQKEKIRTRLRRRYGIGKQDRVVLIISSNLRNLDFDFGFSDRDILETVFQALESASSPRRVKCLIKPHPLEPREELAGLVRGRAKVMESGDSPLEAVLGADVVVGSVSSLIYEAALLGRQVLSLQPALFPGPGQTLGLFTRMGIPEISSPQEAGEYLGRWLEKNSDPLPIPLDRPGCTGRAVENLKALIQEALRENRGPDPGIQTDKGQTGTEPCSMA